ncbi:MAG: transporter substrate-binding protein [Rhodoferax sp.]|nr:transporter substrate-binding protein [Rhodoferax sp.]
MNASADDYPNKPIKIVVGFAAGGLTDQIARLVANGLSQRIGQQVIVENKAGGNLIPATQYVAKAAPDGYTLHLANGQPFTVNVAYYKEKGLPYGRRDYTAVALTSEIPMGIYVPADSPFKTLADLVAFAKANPGKLNYGSPGTLGQGGLGMEAFKYTAGVDIQQVPYQGGAPALLAMLSGQVQMILSDVASAAQYIQAGKVRVLVIAQKKRLATLPDVPTFAEAGYPNVEIPMVWNGVFAPPNTPRPIVDKLNAAINAAMQTPEARKFLQDSSLLPAIETPEKMAALTQSDYEVFEPLMKRLGLKNAD